MLAHIRLSLTWFASQAALQGDHPPRWALLWSLYGTMTESPFAPVGVTPPSSLLRAHAPDLAPLLPLAARSGSQSVQVAASPCWQEAVPDVISAILV